MPALTEIQLKTAALLAADVTQNDAAKRGGISRSSITRWLKSADFQAEVERRRVKATELHQELGDALQSEEISRFYSDLKAYREARIQIYRAKLSRGTKILKRAGERFDDLPDEAIAPQSLVGLFGIADQLCESGLNGWAELLALDELLRRLDSNG